MFSGERSEPDWRLLRVEGSLKLKKLRIVRALHGESSTGLALVTSVGARERGQRTSFGRFRLGTSFEEPPQARLVKIAHGRLAAWLDPFGMLPSQVVVNLSLKLGHGVGRVTD